MDVFSLLRTQGNITEDTLTAIERRVTAEGVSYEDAMLAHNVPPDVIRMVLSKYYGVPANTFDSNARLPQEVLSYISEESARHYRIVPYAIEDGVLVVATNDPDNLQVREVLNFVSTKHNMPYKLVFMMSDDIERALNFYESLKSEVGQALGTLENEIDTEIAAKEQAQETKTSIDSNLDHLKEDAPVTKIVATILRYAVDGGASDVHIEPTEDTVIVRFRVDGLLQKSLELPHNVQSAVVARVKILSSIRLDERRKPQDGRFSATFDGRKIDFRVSVFPTSHGEKVVMRILDNIRGVNTLEEVGLSPYHIEIIRRALKEPYGIILISGPTGSGKSTTLYAMMDEVDKDTKNVLSLEDPVEYNISGVSQSQVRPEIGYTFASGLRSALRQDPDIIMVGEIRDKETAQLAIQAALTGHLVLSTIHTNNAIGVVPRLIDMGVDPYLIAPTLKLAIAQRLARRLCPNSGKSVAVAGGIKTRIDKTFLDLPAKYRSRIPQSTTLLSPEPSPICSSGTKGRIAIMEALEITDTIQELILRGASEDEVFRAARQNGFTTLYEDAIIKALNHQIPYEEMNSFSSNIGLDIDFKDSLVTEPGELPAVDEAVSLASPAGAIDTPDQPVDNPHQMSDTSV